MQIKETNRRWILLAILVGIIVCIICIFLCIVPSINNFKPDLQTQLDTLDKVLQYHNITLINQQTLENDNKIDEILYVSFPYNTVEENTTTENYYMEALSNISKVLGYKNFEIIDDVKSLKIEVYHNQTEKKITSILINGKENYFEELQTMLNLNLDSKTSTTSFSVEDEILKQVIKSNWKEEGISIGDKTTTINNYDIYFDKGLEVKIINKKIKNVVFTEKYKNKIVNSLGTNSSFDEIIKALGEPAYGEKNSRVIGYLGETYYIFFSKNQISLYPIEKIDTQKFSEAISVFSDTKDAYNLVFQVKTIWPDFDVFNYHANTDFLLNYIDKGVKIQFNMGSPNGIILYQNYKGNVANGITIQDIKDGKKELPEHVQIVATDSVYEYEQSRMMSVLNHMYSYQQYQYTYLDSKGKFPDTYANNRYNDYQHKSSKFFITRSNNNAYVQSTTNEMAPFQIPGIVSTIWIDDTHLLYSANGQGIYCYNAVTRENEKIADDNEGFDLTIDSYINETITYNKTTTIQWKMK